MLQTIAEKFKALYVAKQEKIETFVKAFSMTQVPVNILNKEKAIKNVKNLDLQKSVVFTNRSAQNNIIGIGIK